MFIYLYSSPDTFKTRYGWNILEYCKMILGHKTKDPTIMHGLVR